MEILVPSRRLLVPGRCPVHPWRPPRRVPTRRPLSRWRRPVDTLNAHLTKGADGHLLKTATGHLAKTCGDGGFTPCGECPEGDLSPACVRVTFASHVVCGCHSDSGDWSVTGVLNGTYDLIGDGFCGWTSTAPLVLNEHDFAEVPCAGTVAREYTPYYITLGYAGGSWGIIVEKLISAFSSLLFSGTVAAANCTDPFTIDNDYLACDPQFYGSGGADSTDGYDGSVTGTPYGC